MIHQFHVTLLPDAQALLRVLGLFAQRQIVPHSVICRQQGNGLMAEIEVADLHGQEAQILAAKLQQQLLVIDCEYGGKTANLAA